MHHTHRSNKKLAFEATTHCLLGCGIGDVLGVIIGTIIGLHYYSSVALGVFLGFSMGFVLGIIPLIKANMTLTHSIKVILTTEFLSIVVMETAEVIIELSFPGMKKMGFVHFQYWLGLATSLLAGFLAAYPVNLLLISKGVRHQH